MFLITAMLILSLLVRVKAVDSSTLLALAAPSLITKISVELRVLEDAEL